MWLSKLYKNQIFLKYQTTAQLTFYQVIKANESTHFYLFNYLVD